MDKKKLIEVNRWSAEECGIEVFKKGLMLVYDIPDNPCREWTIEDARCREIVREKFKIETLFDYNLKNWFAEGQKRMDTGRGKTIAEAEISCILNIVDSLDEA